jgi:hypothetical protein
MQMAFDLLRETFTLYLGIGILFTFASAWAAVMAVRAEKSGRDPRWPSR